MLGEIIDSYKWLDFKKMSAYYVEQGDIQACSDDEFEAINNEIIDGASEEINADYEKMVELKFDNGMEATN